jgi:hypothetical protein
VVAPVAPAVRARALAGGADEPEVPVVPVLVLVALLEPG